ncbi:MAG TPA: hypothetical protein VHM28_02915 [Anaerolineales bacterium]|nr:hypothetical protein [Anaerolineales bacterium]
MSKSRFLWLAVIFAAVSCGCSIDISTQQSQPPAIENGTPSGWKNLDLTGRLIYTSSKFDITQGISLASSIQTLDLASGEITTIYKAPPGAWIDSEAVSPDYKQLIISYKPPADPPFSGQQQALYRLPLDGSREPELLFTISSNGDRYFQPEWSSDGAYVYFVHISDHKPGTYAIARVIYPDGKLEDVVEDAHWPRISNDGSRLAYVSPVTGVNMLFVANADGTNARQVPLSGPYIPTVIDAPLFLADDQSIFFSAPVAEQFFAPGWADRIFGITVASADGVIPSDWWSVPVAGGNPKRLTHLESLALFASFSPDKKHIASYSADGIFVMNSDGSEVTRVVDHTGGLNGSISWIP